MSKHRNRNRIRPFRPGFPKAPGQQPQPNRFQYHVAGAWSLGNQSGFMSEGVTTTTPLFDEAHVKKLEEALAAQLHASDTKSGAQILGQKASFTILNFILLRAFYEEGEIDQAPQQGDGTTGGGSPPSAG